MIYCSGVFTFALNATGFGDELRGSVDIPRRKGEPHVPACSQPAGDARTLDSRQQRTRCPILLISSLHSRSIR